MSSSKPRSEGSTRAPAAGASNDTPCISISRPALAACVASAAALHRRLADALPADHLPAEAADVAMAASLADQLAGLLST